MASCSHKFDRIGTKICLKLDTMSSLGKNTAAKCTINMLYNFICIFWS